jgi:PAS domain S-box-containing protein
LPEAEVPPTVPVESAEELYENAPCGYLTTRPDGTIARVNRTLLRWTGYDADALLSGRRFQDLLTVPGRIYYETHFAPLLRLQGEVREVAFDLLLDNGARLPVLVNSVEHRDGRGEPVSIRTTLLDATDRRRYERELILARRRAEQLAEVVNASGDAILLMTPEGIVQGWNRGAERLFGLPAAEAEGRNIRALLVPADRLEEYDRIAGEALTGREVRLETVWLGQGGRPLEVSLTLTPHVEAPGEVTAISSIIRDISERRRIEAERRQAEQLHAVGTLAGGVAHEVNNQMTVVLGLGAFVRRDLGDGHPQLRDVEGMMTAAERAADISRQLLAFGRRQLMDPQLLDLPRLVRDIAPRLERLLGPDTQLVVREEHASAPVRADMAQIEQILVNLAANARDAMEAGGRLTIGIEDAVLTAADARNHPADHIVPGPYVLLTVADTGHGIDAATLPRIFEPFFTTKPVGAGSGLGLSTVHGIVKQHGGQLWVTSAPGAGTTMRVYLPAAEPGVATVPTPGGLAAPAAAVLVVEDEPALRTLARRALQAAGLSVIEAENGRHALDLLAASAAPPGVVLADVMMLEMSGRQLGEAIGRQWPQVHILYTSASPVLDMAASGFLPPDAPFLQKPFTPDELVSRVSELLRQGQPSTL